MEMEIENPTVNQEKKDNCFALVSAVAELYAQHEYFDVTLQVANRLFRSHRLLLAAFSKVFHAMFSGNFRERNVSENEPIILHCVDDPEVFALILHFMYSGDVINVTNSNVYAVLTTVDLLDLKNSVYIETKCVELIRENVEGLELIPNAIKIFKLARVTNREVLIELLQKHICLHLCLLSTEDTLEISYDDLNELLVPGYPFWLCNQDVVLNFIIGWVHLFREERKHHFKELLKLVDLKTVSTNCILSVLNEYEKLIDCSEGAEIADDTSLELFSTLPYSNNRAKSEITITFVKGNFRAMKVGEKFLSPACLIQDLPWRISIYKTATNHIAFYLQCDGHPSKKWTRSVKYDSSILSQRRRRRSFTRKGKQHIYDEKSSCWGRREFANWDSVTDPEKGLIRDDIVIFQAHVTAVLVSNI